LNFLEDEVFEATVFEDGFQNSKRPKIKRPKIKRPKIQLSEIPGDGSCCASSSWAPRQVVAFRSGIAVVGFVRPRAPSIQSFRARRLRLQSVPMAVTGF
jgi:hypothetical protein